MTTGEQIQKLKIPRDNFFSHQSQKTTRAYFFGVTFGSSLQTKHTQMQK
jgi:hypothetical protein